MKDRISQGLLSQSVYDLPASLVVFLVALPLCLGIALASGAPLASGLIAGVVGGLVAGSVSKSNVSVSGPAAGLSTVVFASINELGSFQLFLSAVVIAGAIQLVLGFLRVGSVGYFVPHSVIKGMLSAIGLILILKQVPHAVGYDRDFEGDETFFQGDGQNTFTEIIEAWQYLTAGAAIIAGVSLLIMIYWDRIRYRTRALQFVPAPLVVVLIAVLLNFLFREFLPGFYLSGNHLVSLPGFEGWASAANVFTAPDWTGFAILPVWRIAITIALIASLESLLSVEACDRLDPLHRTTPLNRELKAQGITNMLSGLVGGLPVTAVIVRSSANIQAGAKSKASAIFHGVWLLVSVFTFPHWLELIPLASLAGILIHVGFKLAAPGVFADMYARGKEQFLPFLVTLSAILLSDILIGILIGLVISVFFVLKSNYRTAIILVNNDNLYMLKFTKDVSFMHKSSLKMALQSIPEGASLMIDESKWTVVDSDIRETIDDFVQEAPKRSIQVEVRK